MVVIDNHTERTTVSIDFPPGIKSTKCKTHTHRRVLPINTVIDFQRVSRYSRRLPYAATIEYTLYKQKGHHTVRGVVNHNACHMTPNPHIITIKVVA